MEEWGVSSVGAWYSGVWPVSCCMDSLFFQARDRDHDVRVYLVGMGLGQT